MTLKEIRKNAPKGATHYRDDTEYPIYWKLAENGLFYFTHSGDLRRSFSKAAEILIKELYNAKSDSHI